MFDLARKLLRAYFNTGVLSGFRGWRATGVLFAGLFLICGTAVYASTADALAPDSTAAAKHVAANYGNHIHGHHQLVSDKGQLSTRPCARPIENR